MQRKKKSDVSAENRNKLVESRTNPRLFWKMIKDSGTSSSSMANSGIKSYEWYNYFRDLLDIKHDTNDSNENLLQIL